MPPSLTASRFTAAKLPIVQGFTCTTESWCLQATKFITSDATVRGSGLWTIENRGNEIFLYFDGTMLVGFASLGITNWQIPPPNGPSTRLAYIPQFAIATDFQSKPENVPREQRFSRVVLNDILGRAMKLPDVTHICLHVHDGNKKAISLYEEYGFACMDVRKGLMRMMRRLR